MLGHVNQLIVPLIMGNMMEKQFQTFPYDFYSISSIIGEKPSFLNTWRVYKYLNYCLYVKRTIFLKMIFK